MAIMYYVLWQGQKKHIQKNVVHEHIWMDGLNTVIAIHLSMTRTSKSIDTPFILEQYMFDSLWDPFKMTSCKSDRFLTLPFPFSLGMWCHLWMTPSVSKVLHTKCIRWDQMKLPMLHHLCLHMRGMKSSKLIS